MKKKKLAAAVCLATALSGCATPGGGKQDNPFAGINKAFKDTFANDNPCEHSMRNIGIATGAIFGAVIGNQIDHSTGARLAGAAAGALVGGAIGNSIDKRECEVWQIAQANHVPVKVDTITDNKGNKVGADISLQSQDDEQFKPGSSELTPEANKYFNEIANKYSYEEQQASLPNTATQGDKDAVASLQDSRIMLVGHTDDSGNSSQNATLSAERAKEVAKIFKAHGISEDRIYYQGAGESHPIADNKTPDGRAKNRRVEIVDVASNEQLKTFIDSRTTKPSYFSDPTTAPIKDNFDGIDYGGKPLGNNYSMINLGAANSGGFSLISEAHAEDLSFPPCSRDTYHASSKIRSLDGKELVTADYLPGFYGGSWVAMSNNNLVALNDVRVLRDGAIPVGHPKLLVYKNYADKKQKPLIQADVDVNAYRGSEAVLYRAYPKHGMSCMDIIVPNKTPDESKSAKLYYAKGKENYVAQIDAKLVKSH